MSFSMKQEEEKTCPSTSNTSTDNYQNCPICLSTFDSDLLASLDVCAHKFCLECIQEWSKKINTCPIDRKKYDYIIVKRKRNSEVVKRIKVEDRTNIDLNEYQDLTFCEICNQSNREDRMLLCDGCDKGFHCECLNPPIDDIPHGDWYCPRCIRIRGPTRSNHALNNLDNVITNVIERVIARTNFSERIRRSVNENRLGGSRGGGGELGARTSSSVFATRTSSITRAIRKKTIKRRRRKIKRRKTVRKRKTIKTESTGLKTSLNKTLGNKITKRKIKRKRKTKYKKRKVLKKTYKINSLKIKRKFLNQAKQRIIKNIVKMNEQRGVNSQCNNVTSNLMINDISYALPISSSVSVSSSSSSSGISSYDSNNNSSDRELMTNTQRNYSIKNEAATSSMTTTSFDLLDTLLSKQNLLHKKSDEIQVKADGSLNILNKCKSTLNSGTTSIKSKVNEPILSRNKSLDAKSEIKKENSQSKMNTKLLNYKIPKISNSIKSDVLNAKEAKFSHTELYQVRTKPKLEIKAEPMDLKNSNGGLKEMPNVSIKSEKDSNLNLKEQIISQKPNEVKNGEMAIKIKIEIKAEKIDQEISGENNNISKKSPNNSNTVNFLNDGNPKLKSQLTTEFDREKIADIAKQVLKPYFVNKIIDKDQYKLIMKKVVIKTESHIQAGSSISAEKIINLANAYINKIKTT